MSNDCGAHGDDHCGCDCRVILWILAICRCRRCDDDCDRDDCDPCKIRRIVVCLVVGVAALCGFIVLIVVLVLHPSNPEYKLNDTTVCNFTLSHDYNLLSVTFQIVLTTRNPNDRVGIYYDKLDVYAMYKDQQITVPSLLPTNYMGHEDVAMWSPYLVGAYVPLTPDLAVALAGDESSGILLINVKVDGRLRWKVGSWVSGHYYIFVNCPAFLTVDNGNGVGSVRYHFQQMSTCSVEI